MKSIWIALVTGVLLGAAGCAPVGPSTSPPVAPEPPPRVDLQQLRQRLGALPGVTLVQREDEVLARYDGETLFSRGAALPFPRGSELLDPLAGLMRETVIGFWRLEVSAEAGEGESYDRVLAEKRREILNTYLVRRGLASDRFEVVAGPGEAPLSVIYRPAGSSSSSEPNE